MYILFSECDTQSVWNPSRACNMYVTLNHLVFGFFPFSYVLVPFLSAKFSGSTIWQNIRWMHWNTLDFRINSQKNTCCWSLPSAVGVVVKLNWGSAKAAWLYRFLEYIAFAMCLCVGQRNTRLLERINRLDTVPHDRDDDDTKQTAEQRYGAGNPFGAAANAVCNEYIVCLRVYHLLI